MSCFEYPQVRPERRRHGPAGYANYQSYRPWLRDEFSFRCVYCLLREQWGRVTGEFDLDHFKPQASNPERSTQYNNLLYACRRCNLIKLDQNVPDPTACLTAEKVRVYPDGSIEGGTSDAKRLIKILDLNAPQVKQWRMTWIRNVELAKNFDPDQYRRILGFPEDLPMLSRLLPPGGNSRPEGVEESYYAQRERGELPEVY